MDYMKESVVFKVKKILRFTSLYGPARTFTKVKSQLHMKKSLGFDGDTWINPKGTSKKSGDIAIVGCGNFSFSTIAYYLAKSSQGCVKYALDVDKSKSRSLAKEYNLYAAVSDYQHILNDSAIKIIYIASNHASHAEYAIEAIKAGKSVHIEKPHAVREEQLDRLIQTMQEYPKAKVFLGFNRPKSALFSKLMDRMNREAGNSMLNWFIAGHKIEDNHWYFSEEEGGRVLGNLCHWSDLCIHLVGIKNAFPCTINPAFSKDTKSNFAVSITFNDGSQASITFSAKGHTFEGVREYLNVHKGNLLASLSDFHRLTVDLQDKRKKYTLLYRDHGHKANIINSYNNTVRQGLPGESVDYVKGTGLLILRIKEAIETGQQVICSL